VYDLEIGEIFVSWDVVLCEHAYPFANKSEATDSENEQRNISGSPLVTDDGLEPCREKEAQCSGSGDRGSPGEEGLGYLGHRDMLEEDRTETESGA